jgi:hypothetical protein
MRTLGFRLAGLGLGQRGAALLDMLSRPFPAPSQSLQDAKAGRVDSRPKVTIDHSPCANQEQSNRRKTSKFMVSKIPLMRALCLSISFGLSRTPKRTLLKNVLNRIELA